MSEFSDAEELIKGKLIRSGDDLARTKREHTHTQLEHLDHGCPINRALPSGCFICGYTDIVGYCCYPTNIEAEIEAGRAQPLRHDYDWPERTAHYAAIAARARGKRSDDK